MIQLLFGLIFGEIGVILILSFKTPFRKLVIMGIDRAKRGRGPLIVKSVAATIFVIMAYTVYTVQELYNRPIESFNPTDQVLLGYQILQASLMGFSLFLAFMVDKLHHYMRELRMLRKTQDALKKQSWGSGEGKAGNGPDPNIFKDEISSLRSKVSVLEAECQAKGKEVETTKADEKSVKLQSEHLRVQYDRLLEENHHLKSQLQSLSDSTGKKKM